MNYTIFNKSSESMDEIESESIDLVFSSPPHNLKTSYEEFKDDYEFDKYFDLMKNVISECFRVNTNNGRLIVEVADSIFTKGKYIQLAGLIQKLVIAEGYYLETRHINFINTKNLIELPDSDHKIDKNYLTTINSHSNCHQILVFRKKQVKFTQGEILYINYLNSLGHPYEEPKKMIEFILNKYFKSGMSLLDPFMGTAGLGAEVIKQQGYFFGYELVKKYFNLAKEKLNN